MPLQSARECFTRGVTREIEKLRRIVFDESSNINLHNEKYLTPLHVAVKYGQEDCVEQLLKRGANPNRHVW